MPNGRNAGRLFPDCENRYGYGDSHRVVRVDNDEPPAETDRPVKVKCVLCERQFILTDQGLQPVD